MNEKTLLKDLELIAFDLETSGKYPLGFEICEMAAVKWKNGKVIDQYEALVKPSKAMSEEVIKIHGISNEMVASAPAIQDVIKDFRAFVQDGVMLAHHAPFDMGFLAWEFERAGFEALENPVLCSSLLSRQLIRESPNHRLVTLAKTLNVSPGNSHRALDDAKTCLQVGLECVRRFGEDKTLEELVRYQGQDLRWKLFSIQELQEKDVGRLLSRAILDQSDVLMTYEGGSRPGRERRVTPLGIVRGPERDFLAAYDHDGDQEKRYYLSRIQAVRFPL